MSLGRADAAGFNLTALTRHAATRRLQRSGRDGHSTVYWIRLAGLASRGLARETAGRCGAPPDMAAVCRSWRPASSSRANYEVIGQTRRASWFLQDNQLELVLSSSTACDADNSGRRGANNSARIAFYCAKNAEEVSDLMVLLCVVLCCLM